MSFAMGMSGKKGKEHRVFRLVQLAVGVRHRPAVLAGEDLLDVRSGRDRNVVRARGGAALSDAAPRALAATFQSGCVSVAPKAHRRSHLAGSATPIRWSPIAPE